MKNTTATPFLSAAFLRILSALLCLAAADAFAKDTPPNPSAAALSGKYTRLVQTGDDDFAMELAVRTFVPVSGKGASITLVSAVHIGAETYYDRLQEILDARALLLFEGVGGDPSQPRGEDSDGRDSGDLYGQLARAGGLVTQAGAIKYDRKHFKNADLSMREMRKILGAEIKRGGAKAPAAREALALLNETETMLKSGGGFASLVTLALSNMIQNDPQFRALFLFKISTAEQENGAFPALISTPGLRRLERLLLRDRNAAVIAALKAELARPDAPSDIGVFYGAAHMSDMEKTLVRRMGYKLAKTEWLPAFTLHPKAAQLPASAIESFVRAAAGNPGPP